jgi:hypothetical protein
MTNAQLDALAVKVDQQGVIRARLAKLPKLTVTRFADIDREPRKVWLVQDWLGAAEFSCVFGKPGSGKSALVGDLACHVAARWEWFGRRVRGGAVLYVAAERAALVARRFAAFRLRHDVHDLPLSLVSGSVDLRTNQTYVDALAAHAELLPEPAALIVVDTLSRALAGGDENAPKDMGALRDNLLRLQERTGAHVLVVHHIPADGTPRLRGHGVMLGSFDTTICVEKQGDVRTATLDKANDGLDEGRIAFELHSVTIAPADGDDPETTAPVVMAAETPARPPADQKLPERYRLALDALRDTMFDNKPVPIGLWRAELLKRGIVDKDAKNPRENFRRIKIKLQALTRLGERDGLVWAA